MKRVGGKQILKWKPRIGKRKGLPEVKWKDDLRQVADHKISKSVDRPKRFSLKKELKKRRNNVYYLTSSKKKRKEYQGRRLRFLPRQHTYSLTQARCSARFGVMTYALY